MFVIRGIYGTSVSEQLFSNFFFFYFLNVCFFSFIACSSNSKDFLRIFNIVKFVTGQN